MRRPLVLFNGGVWGEGMMPCWHVRELNCLPYDLPYDARVRVSENSVCGAAHKILAGIRANQNCANVTACALVSVMR